MNPASPSHAPADLVSVVMPCFDAERYVAEAVASVLGQTHRNVELIVVDDGSGDRSPVILAELAAAHPGRMRVLHTPRRGPYPARNVGLKAARGDYVAFLDADDWWLPSTLQQLLAALQGQEADLAYCGWQNVGVGIHSKPYVPPAYEAGDPVAQFLRSCPWPIHAALVRRSIVDRLGGFSERRFASMDYDFWLRVLGQTRRIVRVPEVLAFYRWHGSGQISAVKWRQVLDALEAQQGFIRAHPELIAHLPAEQIRDLTEGQVLRQAYIAFWRRDLVAARHLFRHSARARSVGWRDLAHVAWALLPAGLGLGLIASRDRRDGSAPEG
ncbi:MAG: glycosyltransferase [Burkholderiales bacterium]|nr:glycosyltransferase [Burkholderiales bacterium]